jgi:hypothetical protein
MVEGHGLFALFYQMVIQDVYHLQKGHVRIEAVYYVVYQFAGSAGVLLSPNL